MTDAAKIAARQWIERATRWAAVRHASAPWGTDEDAYMVDRLLDALTEALARAERAEARNVKLWALLDDIDTLDDICRSHDDLFRTMARALQQKRHAIMSGEEWEAASRSATLSDLIAGDAHLIDAKGEG